MNFFKLYIGDYQRDTAHLSVTEHGAYLLMLQHYYSTEKPLPMGKALHRMLRAQDKAEREAIDAVASQFWTTTEAGLVNERADREITKAGDQADTNRRIAKEREAARKAARAGHEKSTNRATNGQPNQTPDTRQPEESASALSARAQVGSALKAAGMDLTRVNLSDPRVDALLTAGATAEQFAGLASEAIRGKKSNAWAWLLAVMPERMATAAGVKATGHAGFAAKDYRNGVESDGTFTA